MTCQRGHIKLKTKKKVQDEEEVLGQPEPVRPAKRNGKRTATIPSGLCDRANLFLYIHVKPYCAKEGLKESWPLQACPVDGMIPSTDV